MHNELDEDDIQEDIVDMDTMLDEHQVPQRHVNLEGNHIPDEIIFAPGEGQIFIGVFHGENAEAFTFPAIFLGQHRPNNHRHLPINCRDICKCELRSVNRRVANNVPYMFFKLKKTQMKQVLDKVSLVVHQCKIKAKHLT